MKLADNPNDNFPPGIAQVQDLEVMGPILLIEGGTRVSIHMCHMVLTRQIQPVSIFGQPLFEITFCLLTCLRACTAMVTTFFFQSYYSKSGIKENIPVLSNVLFGLKTPKKSISPKETFKRALEQRRRWSLSWKTLALPILAESLQTDG